MKRKSTTKQRTPQTQARQPGVESQATLGPESEKEEIRGSGWLQGEIASISGIGKAVAVAFAEEGADLAISYLGKEYAPDETSVEAVKFRGRRFKFPGGIAASARCRKLVDTVVKKWGHLDVLINYDCVVPGPARPLPVPFSANTVEKFGSNDPVARNGQPEEVAPCYAFLASSESSYITGQVLLPNGGEILNT